MISAPFEYQRASSLDDALAKLQAAGGAGRLIAGGHSLVPLMKFRLSEPKVLIDIARVPELSGIRETGGRIEIGAATVHHEVATSALLRGQCPVLAEAAASIGDPQVRNRGTIGGSLAHADPSADYPAAILALEADIHIRGPRAERVVKAGDFFRDLFTVDVGADEIVTAITFAPARVSAYAKMYQRASHFAIVGVAAALEISGDTIRSARIGLTGAGPFATRLGNVEQALSGQPLSDDALGRAAGAAAQGLEHVNSDLHASEAYRRAMVPVFTRRALEAARARASRS